MMLCGKRVMCGRRHGSLVCRALCSIGDHLCSLWSKRGSEIFGVWWIDLAIETVHFKLHTSTLTHGLATWHAGRREDVCGVGLAAGRCRG
jgi:hypothetical protein